MHAHHAQTDFLVEGIGLAVQVDHAAVLVGTAANDDGPVLESGAARPALPYLA